MARRKTLIFPRMEKKEKGLERCTEVRKEKAKSTKKPSRRKKLHETIFLVPRVHTAATLAQKGEKRYQER